MDKKIVILLGDGMPDFPIKSLGGKTPLEAASTPNIDYIVKNGIMGMAKTVPSGMTPGSDTANLSIFGYDPVKYYTGRAPLEAISMDIDLKPEDAAFRCNIVNINNDIMKDFAAGHIDTEFSKIVIKEMIDNTKIKGLEFYPGVSYRNILIWRDYPYKNIIKTTPPHDIIDRNITGHIPVGEGAETLIDLMEKSVKIIEQSVIVKDAREKLKGSPNSIWLWGGGKKPSMDSLEKKFGLHGHTISAVDLIHGIGKALGLAPIPVKGATGYIDTNYDGKAEALLEGIKKSNFIYLHVESPDESGHEGNLENKIKAIEDFDKKIVGPVFEGMKKYDDYAIMVLPDHPTPIKLRTHTSDPVPFCIYNKKGWSKMEHENGSIFSEKSAKDTGLFLNEARLLIDLMINNKL